MIIPLNADGWIAYDGDGEYLTLFLDEPVQDTRGRWFVSDPARSMVVQRVGSAVQFSIGEKILSAGEKIKFVGLEIE